MDYGAFRKRLGRRRGFDGNTTRLGDFINDAYMTICSRRSNWSWLRRTAQFRVIGKEVAVDNGTWQHGNSCITFQLEDTGHPAGGQHKLNEDTLSGGKLLGPDGNLYRIGTRGTANVVGLDADGIGLVQLETSYVGTSSTTHKATLYTDEYPLPLAAGELESVIYTGNGQTNNTRSLSLLPQHMHGLTVSGYESYPRYYSVERAGTIPAPDLPPTYSVLGGSLAIGYYKYKYRYYNTRTLEMGPFSDETEVEVASSGKVRVTTTRHSDYGIALYRTKGTRVATGRGDTGQEFFFLRIATRDNMAGDPVLEDETPDTGIGVAGAGEFQDQEFDGGWINHELFASASHGRAYEGGTSHIIRFWPPPDADYLVEVKYFVVPQELRLDNDTPLVPRQFHPALMDLAESFALSEEENHGAASVKRQFAMEAINRMERDDEKDPGTNIQIGRGSPDFHEYSLGDGAWPRNITG